MRQELEKTLAAQTLTGNVGADTVVSSRLPWLLWRGQPVAEPGALRTRQLAVALKHQAPRGEPGLLEGRVAPARPPTAPGSSESLQVPAPGSGARVKRLPGQRRGSSRTTEMATTTRTQNVVPACDEVTMALRQNKRQGLSLPL